MLVLEKYYVFPVVGILHDPMSVNIDMLLPGPFINHHMREHDCTDKKSRKRSRIFLHQGQQVFFVDTEYFAILQTRAWNSLTCGIIRTWSRGCLLQLGLALGLG